MITGVNRRHKSAGGNYRVTEKKKVQRVLKVTIGCMRVKMTM